MVLAEAGEEFSLCQIDWGPVVSAGSRWCWEDQSQMLLRKDYA